jgi:outer membrane lipoprotein SlyB
VREFERKGEGSGLGAIAGGITGALLGNQIGQGNGRTAMTVLGAAGGAYAGNQVERNVKTNRGYQVSVRFEDGSTQTFNYDSPSQFRSGDRVRVVNGQLQSNYSSN